MSTLAFQQVLDGSGACEASLDWCGDRSAAQAYRDCTDASWMRWCMIKFSLPDEERAWLAIRIARDLPPGDPDAAEYLEVAEGLLREGRYSHWEQRVAELTNRVTRRYYCARSHVLLNVLDVARQAARGTLPSTIAMDFAEASCITAEILGIQEADLIRRHFPLERWLAMVEAREQYLEAVQSGAR